MLNMPAETRCNSKKGHTLSDCRTSSLWRNRLSATNQLLSIIPFNLNINMSFADVSNAMQNQKINQFHSCWVTHQFLKQAVERRGKEGFLQSMLFFGIDAALQLVFEIWQPPCTPPHHPHPHHFNIKPHRTCWKDVESPWSKPHH